MMDTPGLLPACKWRIIFNVPRILCVMSQFVYGVLSKAQVLFFEAQAKVPIKGKLLPILKNFHTFFIPRLNIVLQFHLLKFTLAVKKVTWSNFVSECLTYLTNTKRNFRMHRIKYVLKINMYPLCYLPTQINISCTLFRSTEFSLN